MRKSSPPDKRLTETSNVLKALAHPLRMKILQFIDQNKSANVNRIYAALGVEQSIASQHLRILRTAGLVWTARAGKFIHYAVDYDRVEDTTKAVGVFMKEKSETPEND